MRCILLLIVLLVVSVLPNATQAERPPFPKLLPEKTYLMLRLDNAAKFREALNRSALGKLLADPQMKPFVEEIYGSIGAWFTEQSGEFGLQLGELATIPQGECAIALVGKDYVDNNAEGAKPEAAPNPSQTTDEEREARRRRRREVRIDLNNTLAKTFDLLIMIDTKERSGMMRGLMEQLELRASQQAPMREFKVAGNVRVHAWTLAEGQEFGWGEREGTFVFSSGLSTLENYFDAWQKGELTNSLASKPAFASALTPCLATDDEPPQITFFFDMVGLLRGASEGNASMKMGLQLMDQFGLGNIRGIGASLLAGGKEYNWIVHSHVLLDGPRTGLLGLIQPETGDLKPPRWVPDDVSRFSAARWNLKKTANGIERVVEKIAGSSYWEQTVEKFIKDRLGVELEADILEQFRGPLYTIQWNEPPARVGSTVGLIAAEMTDLETAEKNLVIIGEKRKFLGPRETYAGARLYPVSYGIPLNGDDPLVRKLTPTVMCLDKYMFFSDSRPLLEKVARTLNDADAPRLSNRTEQEIVAGEISGLLDGKEPFYMSFIDPAEALRNIYELAQSPEAKNRLQGYEQRFAPAGAIARVLTDRKLPPFALLRQYFSPGGAAAYDEPTGLHFFSFAMLPEK